jgi:hypothetical protein
MPSPLNDTQRRFLENFLGVRGEDIGSGNRSDREATPLLPIWSGAKDRIDDQITALIKALTNHGHPAFRSLAESGLGGMLEGQHARFVAALMDFDNAPAQARSKPADKLQKAINGLRQTLDRSNEVDLMDKNPLGVKLEVRAILESALDQMEIAVRNAA